jgi:hypothetical protein
MQHALDYCSDGSYFIITAKGDPELSGFLCYLEDLFAHPMWRPGMPWLVDLRELNISGLNTADVRDIGKALIPFLDQIADCRIAGVVSVASHFGVVRMFQGVTNDMLRNLQVFYDMENAREWVGSGLLKLV